MWQHFFHSYIAKSPVFHERTKYIEADFRFFLDVLQIGLITLNRVFPVILR